MRRCLVVSHQTLESPELIECIRDEFAKHPMTFHLLVPEYYGTGLTWNESDVRREAQRALDSALLRFAALGFPATGEVGEATRFGSGDNPVVAVEEVLRRDGHEAFDQIIISTLPARVSKWLHMDAPARIRRATDIPVTEVVANVPAHA
jgi:GABA permease